MQPRPTAGIFSALLSLSLGAGGTPAGAQTMPEPIPPAEIAVPALAPEATALRDAMAPTLAALPPAEGTAIGQFYALRAYAPFWTEPGSPRGGELAAALDASPAQALPRARYGSEDFAAPTDGRDPAALAAREVGATRAYLRFAADLAKGVLAPSAVIEEITRKPAAPPPAALLAALGEASVAEALQGFEPQDPDYRRLMAEKARLEVMGRTGAWGPEVAAGPTLHPGDDDPRVAEVRSRLARLGYLAPTSEVAGTGFDDPLKQAVARFQRDYGLSDDGVVGAMTLAAMNAPIETRLAQVAVNLERLRWMNGDPEPRYLLVNIPDFTVTLFEEGEPTWSSKVVVGKTRVTETPEFDGVVKTVVVNPTWHIPDSIAIRDYLPKLQRNPMVLKNQGIDLMTRKGTIINPKLVDFTQYTPANFPFRIKQRPSDDNALGEVKFLFPNEHSVYMHDTPHKELFPRDVRAFSNGCIRLEKPVELAHILLAGQVADPAGYYDGLRAGGKEKAVALETTIPVHIVYRTVTFDEAGAARYRPDVYGRDARIFEALKAAGVTLPTAQG
jgi:murein L,D-transpeptidase YcbB/YkuD